MPRLRIAFLASQAPIAREAQVTLSARHGNVGVEDRVELRVTGRIRGDIVAPRVAMAEGSFFRGRLTTSRSARRGGEAPAGS